MYIFGRKVKYIKLNPAFILFLLAASILIANGTVSIWVVLLIILADIKVNMEFPVD